MHLYFKKGAFPLFSQYEKMLKLKVNRFFVFILFMVMNFI